MDEDISRDIGLYGKKQIHYLTSIESMPSDEYVKLIIVLTIIQLSIAKQYSAAFMTFSHLQIEETVCMGTFIIYNYKSVHNSCGSVAVS